jgi:outer membrane protein TolC
MSTPFSFSFPIFLNNYSLQASIAVPISDYFLRINEGYSAATHARDAAEFDALAAKARASADGKIAFYSWLRARGSTVVATRSLQDQRTHLKDARNQFSVGNASKADVLRAETGEAAAELAVERTANLAELAEAQVRIALHTGQEERLLPGENLEINPVPMAGNMKQLVNEALANRYEVKSLDANLLATRRQTALARASHYPQLVGVGNVTYANPNQRLIPSQDKWFGTWDVTAQLTWSPNDNVSATSQVSEAIARTRALEAQRMALRDGIELEVTQAFLAVREADFALDSTRRQLASAVEALRVAEELFRNGRATATLVADAETDLTMSRLQALNAMVDARVGRVRLEHALGRDVQVLSH